LRLQGQTIHQSLLMMKTLLAEGSSADSKAREGCFREGFL
jgi:hypothetical protein